MCVSLHKIFHPFFCSQLRGCILFPRFWKPSQAQLAQFDKLPKIPNEKIIFFSFQFPFFDSSYLNVLHLCLFNFFFSFFSLLFFFPFPFLKELFTTLGGVFSSLVFLLYMYNCMVLSKAAPSPTRASPRPKAPSSRKEINWYACKRHEEISSIITYLKQSYKQKSYFMNFKLII